MNASFGPRLVNLSETTVAKDGNVFSVTLPDGSVPLTAGHPFGVYAEDCRMLSGHVLTLGGAAPWRLVTAETGPGAVTHELTNPQLGELALQTVGLRLERRLDAGGAMAETLTVRSFAHEPLELELTLRVDADFMPMLAIRGMIDAPEGATTRTAIDGGVRLARTGADGVKRSTTVTAEPAPAAGADGALEWTLALPPGGEQVVALDYALHSGPGETERADPPPPAAALELSDALAQRTVDRSLADLRTLRSRMDGLHYYAAGVPWYCTLFGRDSLITAIQAMAFTPEIGAETLRLLARNLGTRTEPVREEDPGKVLHELRLGEVASAALTPLARYFGTVDATPLWLCLLGDHADWTGDLALFEELRGEVEAMLAWLDGPGDRDGDGLLDYAASAPGGLRNQGWKDSTDGVCDADGRWLEPPIALVEAQAYAVRARRRAADLYARAGEPARADELRAAADAAAARLERFWLADRGFYAMALDGDGRPSAALASNQGHLLWAGAVGTDRSAAVRDALMGESMFSGWGIRTFATAQGGYNPVGYHVGSVWPHDTSMIAAGLRGYGFDDDFARVTEALLDAAALCERHRLPELFAGHGRDAFPAPVPYPVACQPQAWAAGAVPYLLWVGLGLVPEALDGRLRVRRPWLPAGVDRAELRGVRVGGSTVDLRFERGADGTVAVADATVAGDVTVEVEPA